MAKAILRRYTFITGASREAQDCTFMTNPNLTPATSATSATSADTPWMETEAFDELDAILDDLRGRYDETPQWEFCERRTARALPGPVDAALE